VLFGGVWDCWDLIKIMPAQLEKLCQAAEAATSPAASPPSRVDNGDYDEQWRAGQITKIV